MVIPAFPMRADSLLVANLWSAPHAEVTEPNFSPDNKSGHSKGTAFIDRLLPEAQHLAIVSDFLLLAYLVQNFLRILIGSARIKNRPQASKAGDQQKTNIEWIHFFLLML